MPAQTVRISQADHTVLEELSKAMGKSMTATLSDAISILKRQQLLDRTNAAYARLMGDADALEAEQQERDTWNDTLLDGMGAPHEFAP